MKNIFGMLGLILLVAVSEVSRAEANRPFQILTGLTQPVFLKGGNIALNYTMQNRFVLETSWGFSLDYANLLTDSEKSTYDSIKSPLTGGFGFGYMPYENLKILWEPKFTQFAIKTNSGEEFDYTTYSAGIGIYYDIIISDIFVIQPAIKYWPRLSSTLNDNKRTFVDKNGITQNHDARAPGNDGTIYNVSIGYAF